MSFVNVLSPLQLLRMHMTQKNKVTRDGLKYRQRGFMVISSYCLRGGLRILVCNYLHLLICMIYISSTCFTSAVPVVHQQYLFFSENDSTQELVFQSSLGDSEIDDGGAGADLRGVRWVRQLSGQIECEASQHIHLFVT